MHNIHSNWLKSVINTISFANKSNVTTVEDINRVFGLQQWNILIECSVYSSGTC